MEELAPCRSDLAIHVILPVVLGGIIAANMRDDRIPDDGFLLLSVAPYQEVGVDRARATLKSRFMADFAAHIIRSDHAKIADKINIRKAVLSWHTRALELIV